MAIRVPKRYAIKHIGPKVNHGRSKTGRFVSAPKISRMENVQWIAPADAIITKIVFNTVVSGTMEGSDKSNNSWGFSAYAALRIKMTKERILWTTPVMMVPCFKLRPQQKVFMLYMAPKSSDLFS